jgi:hypothetical protein
MTFWLKHAFVLNACLKEIGEILPHPPPVRKVSIDFPKTLEEPKTKVP